MTPTSCKRNQRWLALMAGGDLAPRRQARLRSHLAGCSACRELLADLRQVGRLAGDLGRREPAGFRSVRVAVRQAVRQPRRASAAPFRVMWAPAAGVLAVAGILLLGAPDRQKQPTGPQGGVSLRLSSIEDDGTIHLIIDDPAPVVHRVAVSSRSDDFDQAQVFEVRGSTWVDPMPEPEVGEAFFYRVD